MEVPCGKCIACRIQRTNEWTTRIMHEYELTKKGMFITLTYNNEELKYGKSFTSGKPSALQTTPEGGRLHNILPSGNNSGNLHNLNFATLDKSDLQKFFKRLRKQISGVHTTGLKYFACGEYGETTNRPHYHIIITGWQTPLSNIYYNTVTKQMSSRLMDQLWTMGHNVCGTVTNDSIQYTVGYIRKKLYGPNNKIDNEIYTKTGRIPPFQLQSQGIGLDYAKNNIKKLLEGKITVKGKRESVPRYYFKKLKSPELNQIKRDNIINKIYEETEQCIIDNLPYDKKRARDRQVNEVKNGARARIIKERKL
jgi:hypothetical protein